MHAVVQFSPPPCVMRGGLTCARALNRHAQTAASLPHTPPSSPSPGSMKQLTAEQKHEILLHLQHRSQGQSVAEIAALHSVKGGRRTLQNWLQRWDGTPQSLQHRQGSGRPRVLSKTQVKLHVAAPIRNSNRAARVVRYSNLLPQVQAATSTSMSLRTLQRYGHDEAGARQTRGKKRTAEEREYIDTCESGVSSASAQTNGVELTRPRMATCSVCEYV
jgi:hypothetical protein